MFFMVSLACIDVEAVRHMAMQSQNQLIMKK